MKIVKKELSDDMVGEKTVYVSLIDVEDGMMVFAHDQGKEPKASIEDGLAQDMIDGFISNITGGRIDVWKEVVKNRKAIRIRFDVYTPRESKREVH